MNPAITLRAETAADQNFLLDVYASTRSGELALTDWSEAQKSAFLQMQFRAQHAYYHQHYSNAAYLLILQGDTAIGRLYLARWDDEIRLMDIALLPAYRNQGIGTYLIGQVLAEAAQTARAVRIHVEPFNPALPLYQRLGFRKLAERGVYWFMEWTEAPRG